MEENSLNKHESMMNGTSDESVISTNAERFMENQELPTDESRQYQAPSFGFEVLQLSFLLVAFGFGYFACGLLNFQSGSVEHARIIFSIFTGFNLASVYVAWQGLQQIPPRSMLRESLSNMTIALACAAAANSTDLILWLTGAAMLKTTIFPNLFFVSAMVFGIAGVFQLARVCHVAPGFSSAAAFVLIVIVYTLIPFVIDPGTLDRTALAALKKEVIFGFLYSIVIGYMTAVTLKIWGDAQGTLKSSARLVCFGTLLLSFGCSIYGPLFVKLTPLEVGSHWVHILLAAGYFTVGLGVQRMGMTVVAVFSSEFEPLSIEQPLVDVFGPVLGMRVYEAMAGKIKESHERIVRAETESQLRREHIQELEREVQRSTLAEESLKTAKEAAEAAVVSKSHFLSLITHELRTPLSAVSAYGQMLGDSSGPMNKFTTPEVRELGTRIQKSAEHLQRLIDGILQFSKMDNGMTSQDMQHFMLQELLDFITPLAESQAREKGLQFIIEAPSEPVGIYADQQYLRQILINILLNAFKFTSKGSVTLGIEADADSLHLSVVDTGIGIPTENIDKLFEPFYQVSSGITRKFGGVGLGLSIVKRLVTLMKGRITISSSLDHGTRIDIILPEIIPVTK